MRARPLVPVLIILSLIPAPPPPSPPPNKRNTGYPYVVALRASDGNLLYASRLSDHIAALITMAPTIEGTHGYVGISSLEELRAVDKNYPCCDARGSFVKFELATGRILWQTYMTVPSFAGASVWGSMAPIDRARNQVIIATSNNHHRPEVVDACLRALGPLTHANIAEQIACENLAGGEQNWRESIVALDLDTGKINWAQRVGAPDAWNGGCFAGDGSNPNCPKPEGPDDAFGQAPMLVTACRRGSGCKQLAIVAQKSGIVWAVRVDTGALEWHTQVGPGGLIGGMMWGSASDNERVYVSNNNLFHLPLTGLPLVGASGVPTGGMAAALDS